MARQQLVGQGARRAGQGAVPPLGQGDGAAQRGSRERDADERAVAGQRDGGHHGRAEAGGDEGEDTGHLAALAHQMRLHPRLAAGGQGHGAQVVALPEHDEVEAVEVAHPDPPSRAKGWSGAVASTSGSSKSGVVTTSGSVTGSTTRARSTSPDGHLGHQLVRAGLDHRQVDAGVAGVELDQGRAPARW